MTGRLKVALVHEVFFGPEGAAELDRALAEARRGGADLAVLPELPLDPWIPASRTPREHDAEAPGGRRHQALAEASAQAKIAVMGGAIVVDPASGRRHNRALLFNAGGELAASYDKLHIPGEEGFWESDHYEPGTAPPERIDALPVPLGLQVCSDLQRPQCVHLLGAQGAEAVLAPRCTPPASYERWRTVIRAIAITSASYVISVNRPRPESGVEIGGPSIAVAPDGAILAESTDRICTVELDRDVAARARREYPGYLAVRSDLYARAWGALEG